MGWLPARGIMELTQKRLAEENDGGYQPGHVQIVKRFHIRTFVFSLWL